MKKILKILIVLYIILGLGVGVVMVNLENKKAQEATEEVAVAEEPEEVVEPVVEETVEPEETVEETTEDTEEVEEETEEVEEQTFSDDPVDMVVDEENPHYYRFEIQGGGCNVRTGTSTDYEILYTTKTGDTGYVIEAGEGWSKIATEKGIGYCSNRFLTTYEINKSDIPEEYLDEE